MLDGEKHLKVLEELRKTLNVDKGIEFREEIEALNYGLNTMRKYQKIEQIYQKWNEVNDFSYNQAMRKIGEAIEDED